MRYVFLLLLLTSFLFSYDNDDLKTLKTEKDCIACDLSNANLVGIDLKGADLSESDFSGADLSNANLVKTNFYDANLKGAKLVNANARFSNFKKADLSDTNSSGLVFKGSVLAYAKIINADFSVMRDCGILILEKPS